MANFDINLIQRESGPLSKLSGIEDKLRIAAVWYLTVLLFAGAGIGVLFFILNSRIGEMEKAKVQLVREINVQSPKEGLLLSLKERTGIAARALEAARPWGKLFPLMQQVSGEGGYTALSVDDAGKVSAMMELGSIEQAVSITGNLLALNNERMLRTPQITSFAFKSDGSVQLTIAFHPIF